MKLPKIVKIVLPIVGVLLIAAGGVYLFWTTKQKNLLIKQNLEMQIRQLNQQLTGWQSQDQVKINQDLNDKITKVQESYQKTVVVYEDLLAYKDKGGKNTKLDEQLADILNTLSKMDYQSADLKLASLSAGLKTETDKLIASVKIPVNVPQNNTPPSTGYQRQQVTTDAGNFLIDIITADLNSTKVIIDTASDGSCANDCPVIPLADYVSRSGAFAGVNGSYFCPATYPTCVGKTNSFDTLLMNKNKVYFNSDNNVYSTVPVAVFGSNWARFMERSLDWGRDTGVDAVIANQPLLVLGGQIKFGGNDDVKQSSKGNRSFIGNSGNLVYIGVVHSATVAESAKVLQTMGIQNALNLDDGGSTALWSGSYKVGPGRNLPNVVLFIRK